MKEKVEKRKVRREKSKTFSSTGAQFRFAKLRQNSKGIFVRQSVKNDQKSTLVDFWSVCRRQ